MTTDLNLLAAEGYFELEMYEEALDELSTADSLPQNRLQVLAMQLDILLAQKRWKDALPLGEALCDLDPDEPAYFISYAYALRELDRVEEARGTLLQGPESLEESGLFYYNLACYEALLGDAQTALATLRHAFAIDPGLKKTAQDDPDLEAIHDKIAEPEDAS